MVVNLSNLELGVTAWREIINANMTKIIQAFASAASKNGATGENFAAKDIQIGGAVELTGIETITETQLPANPAGFIKVKIKGTIYKMPYYTI
jgi:cell division ATPase FtsA